MHKPALKVFEHVAYGAAVTSAWPRRRSKGCSAAVGIDAVRIGAWLGEHARAKTRNLIHIGTDEGWLFLAVMTVLFSRQAVDLSLRKDMVREIVADAVRMACLNVIHARTSDGFHTATAAASTPSRISGKLSRPMASRLGN